MLGDRRKGCGYRQTRRKKASKGSLLRGPVTSTEMQSTSGTCWLLTLAHVPAAAPDLETLSYVSLSRWPVSSANTVLAPTFSSHSRVSCLKMPL